MAIEMVYLAWVGERIGAAGERVDPPAGVTTVAALLDWLGGRSAGHAAAFGDRTRLRAAVDQRFVALDGALGAAREVAVFPPMTGG